MKQPSAAALAKRTGGPSFAVAFGGGGARGLAHIHVIEALDELGIRPMAIAGSSIGAIMGAGMAAGMSGKEIHDYAHSVLSRRSEVASRMWRARPGSIGEMVRGRLPGRPVQHRAHPEVVPAGGHPGAISPSCKIPLKVTATDFFGHEPDGAARAATSIPRLPRPPRSPPCSGR